MVIVAVTILTIKCFGGFLTKKPVSVSVFAFVINTKKRESTPEAVEVAKFIVYKRKTTACWKKRNLKHKKLKYA